MGRGRPRHPDQLTPAEWRVANAARHGQSNSAISRRLGVSRDAVKYHLANILGKLALTSKSELTQWHGAPRDSALHGAITMAEAGAPAGNAALGPIGQISRQVKDIEASVAWYRDVLGFTHLFTFGNMAFVDCHGIRLFLSAGGKEAGEPGDSVVYFRVADIEATFKTLSDRGVVFLGAPHMIHRHADGMEEWMAFFNDPDAKVLAMMSQVSR